MPRPKKVVNFKATPFKNRSGSTSWRVTGTKPDGTRVRQNYPGKLEAIQAVADLESEVVGHAEVRRALRTSLSPEELADAESASEQAEGVKVSKIVAHYLSLQARARERGVSLDEGMSFLEARYRAETKAITILNAKTEFLASRVKVAKSTLRNYEGSLQLLLKPDPNKFVHAFTVSDIEKVTSGFHNLSSLKTHRRIFSVFFHWAVRHHYCLEDPCKRLDKLPKDMTQIVALSFEEIRRLLCAAMFHQEGVAAATVAIGLFAGLRPSEIADLKPDDVGEKVIRVTGGKLRRKLKRTAPIPPVLAVWLKKYPFKGLPSGWDYKMKALKKATKAAMWVQDIIRHTSISFQAERDQNEALTAYNCGTSIKMMDLHYRNTIDDEKIIKEFWDLTPTKVVATKPEVIMPGRVKIAWPTKSLLEKLVWAKPLVHAGKEIGVSDVSLRKKCLKLGIALPAAGHWLRQR
jgi:integrase